MSSLLYTQPKHKVEYQFMTACQNYSETRGVRFVGLYLTGNGLIMELYLVWVGLEM